MPTQTAILFVTLIGTVAGIHLPRQLPRYKTHLHQLARNVQESGPQSIGGQDSSVSPAAMTPRCDECDCKDGDNDASQAQWLTFNSGTAAQATQSALQLGAVVSADLQSTAVQSEAQGAQSVTQAQSQPAQPSSTQPGGLGPQSQELVDGWVRAHNEARQAHGAGELQWRDDLAWGAKSNAERCAQGHTSLGENIASSTAGMSPEQAVTQWMENAGLWSGKFEEETAHFSQVVWKESQFLGCYIQECQPGTRYGAEYGNSWVATCRYDPPVSHFTESADGLIHHLGAITSPP